MPDTVSRGLSLPKTKANRIGRFFSQTKCLNYMMLTNLCKNFDFELINFNDAEMLLIKTLKSFTIRLIKTA